MMAVEKDSEIEYEMSFDSYIDNSNDCNIQQEMFLEKSDLSVRLGRIAKGIAFDESYYREICVTQDP